jgi:hypothetical protein
MTDEAREIAPLNEQQREAWIWTVLAVVGSDPVRRSFAAGYNNEPCPKPATADKRRYHERGLEVRRLLLEQQS